MDESGSTFPTVFNNYKSVKDAAFHSGSNMQYLRRLLRDGRLTGMKLGQTWLIDVIVSGLARSHAEQSADRINAPDE